MLSFHLIIYHQIKLTFNRIRFQHYVFKQLNQSYSLHLKEELIKQSFLDNGDFRMFYRNP
jgi:hypothetical protein